MPISIAGDGTISGVSVGGLPNGIVDTDMLATSAVATAKIADAAISAAKLAAGVGGKILQVKSDTAYETSTTAIPGTVDNISGLSVTLTPASTSSRFVVMVSLYADGTGTSYGYFQLRRGATQNIGVQHYWSRTAGQAAMIPVFAVDAPSASSDVTYYLYAKTDGGSVYAGRFTMIVYEVAS